jgi:hypothetical protein
MSGSSANLATSFPTGRRFGFAGIVTPENLGPVASADEKVERHPSGTRSVWWNATCRAGFVAGFYDNGS